MSEKKSRAKKINRILKTIYPHVKTQLSYKNPFELLVATILSAQCTDAQVNRVTPVLFEQLAAPTDFAKAPLERIEKIIHPTGFFHNKAKNIKNCAVRLIEKHDGRVPRTLKELVKLPGVGRKTANVVLGAAFGVAGMVVDTHVARISQRLALTGHTNPVKIEFDLMALIPKKDWNDFGLRLIYFGRGVCKARKPLCPSCPLAAHCPYPQKTSR